MSRFTKIQKFILDSKRFGKLKIQKEVIKKYSPYILFHRRFISRVSRQCKVNFIVEVISTIFTVYNKHLKLKQRRIPLALKLLFTK